MCSSSGSSSSREAVRETPGRVAGSRRRIRDGNPDRVGQAPRKPATGNPTPGIAQPDPPNLADRVTFIGCLRARRAEASASADRSASADPNSPSASRFELVNSERQNRVPEGTGGSALAAAASSKTYRLEGIDSIFSPFVGARVRVGIRWERVHAVRGLSLTVPRGAVVAFVGPDGAGKTTTIHSLLGFLKPTAGKVRVFGEPPGPAPRNASDINRKFSTPIRSTRPVMRSGITVNSPECRGLRWPRRSPASSIAWG